MTSASIPVLMRWFLFPESGMRKNGHMAELLSQFSGTVIKVPRLPETLKGVGKELVSDRGWAEEMKNQGADSLLFDYYTLCCFLINMLINMLRKHCLQNLLLFI